MRGSVEIEDRRTLTIPNGVINEADTEQIGKTLQMWAQDGYFLKRVIAVQREAGTQRDPERVTDAVKLVLEKG